MKLENFFLLLSSWKAFIIIVIIIMILISSSLSFKCALRESDCRIGYEPTKNELRSLSAVDFQGRQRGGFSLSPLLLL